MDSDTDAQQATRPSKRSHVTLLLQAPEKIKHFENKEAERQRGRGLYFLKEKKDPKTALIKPNSSIAAHTIINPQPLINPTLLRFQSLKPHDVASFAWCSDGRACLHSSFAGTPPHCWECRAGSYSSFRTALISLDIVGFLHNGRKSPTSWSFPKRNKKKAGQRLGRHKDDETPFRQHCFQRVYTDF